MRLMTNDNDVVNLGCTYLKVIAIQYIFMSVSFVFSYILRSIGIIKVTLVSSISSFTVNIL